MNSIYIFQIAILIIVLIAMIAMIITTHCSLNEKSGNSGDKSTSIPVDNSVNKTSSQVDDAHREHLEIKESLELKAKALEPEMREKAKEILEQYRAEHIRQRDGYYFDCERWGDFLRISIFRAANKTPQLREFSTTINLSRITRIQLKEGHGVDENHPLRYSVVEQPKGFWSQHSRNSRFEKDKKYQVLPLIPEVPENRQRFCDNSREYPESIDHLQFLYWLDYTTPGFPRPSEDDVIHFHGEDYRFHAPYGMGYQVYRKILQEIKGIDNSTLSKDT